MSAKAELLARIQAAPCDEVPGLLRDAPEELKADRELVREAVAQNGSALLFAAPELRADRELVRVAVAQNGDALAFAAILLWWLCGVKEMKMLWHKITIDEFHCIDCSRSLAPDWHALHIPVVPVLAFATKCFADRPPATAEHHYCHEHVAR